jgi:hypothetical protein
LKTKENKEQSVALNMLSKFMFEGVLLESQPRFLLVLPMSFYILFVDL